MKHLWLLMTLSLMGCAHNPCLFGGATEAQDQFCAERQWGTAGLLQNINARVLQTMPPGTKCTGHVALAEKALAGRFKTAHLYSCPDRAPSCHVSLKVFTDEGVYVMDNRAVLDSTVAVSGVARLSVFENR